MAFQLKLKNTKKIIGNSIITIDVDFFKKINDGFGHDVGDDVLISLAKVIVDCCRSEDVVCRFGGEEFIVFLPQTSLLKAEFIAERIRIAVEKTFFQTTYVSQYLPVLLRRIHLLKDLTLY